VLEDGLVVIGDEFSSHFVYALTVAVLDHVANLGQHYLDAMATLLFEIVADVLGEVLLENLGVDLVSTEGDLQVNLPVAEVLRRA